MTRHATWRWELIVALFSAGLLLEHSGLGWRGYMFGGNLVGVAFGAYLWYRPAQARCNARWRGIFPCHRSEGHGGQHLYTSPEDGRSVNW